MLLFYILFFISYELTLFNYINRIKLIDYLNFFCNQELIIIKKVTNGGEKSWLILHSSN